MSGNTNATGDVGESPGKSYLFLLTPSADPGIGLSGDRVGWAGKRGTFCPVRVRSRRPLKIRWTCFIYTPGRTHNRIRSPRCAASGR